MEHTIGLLIAAEKKEGIALLFPAWQEIVIGAVAFAVLFGLLAKFAFPAIKKGLDDRANTIASDLKRAEEAKLEAEDVLAEYRKQLADARSESAKIIEEGRRTADEMRKELLAKAEADAEQIREDGKRDIEAAKSQVSAELRGQVAAMSVDLAGRVIAKNLDTAGQQQTIDDFLAEVEALGNQETSS
jgi:F-type H+-transporting ATPase subunit b